MENSENFIKEYFKTLSSSVQESLLSELMEVHLSNETFGVQHSRREQLENKQGKCPHCHGGKYVKNGKNNEVQRYKCKTCNRFFTEYTGTWLAGLHKKELANEYLLLFYEEKSLDKITGQIDMCKQTAFDWRHKILSSLGGIDKEEFIGITESDETFFPLSEKGTKNLDRTPKKRGTKASKRGVSDEKVAVIVTSDRCQHMELSLATMGRIKKADIEKSIGGRISEKTVLCTDSHVCYKGFAKDNSLEHHTLRADLKEHIKQGKYHIQHVNSLHNRFKRWINEKFWGVSTKYLQQYLNWFTVKEYIKGTVKPISDLANYTVQDLNTVEKFRNIKADFNTLKKSA